MTHAPESSDSATLPPADRFGLVLLVVAVATGLRYLLHPLLGANLQFITYFPAVFLAALLGGFRESLLAVVLSALLAEYLFFTPFGEFDLTDPVALMGLGLFTLTGLGMGWLGETRLRAIARARLEAAEARRQEGAAQTAAIEAEEAAAQAEEESLRAEEEAAQAQRARDEALAAHERTRAVLESTSDGYIALDRQWRIIYVNPQAAATLEPHGVDVSRLFGKTHWEAWPTTVGTELERLYRRVMTERVRSSFEFWYPAFQRWYEIHASPTPGGGIGVFFRDVTERKRSEERLQQAQRMDAVGQLAGGVAHEVNNQMTVVLGAAEFLLRRPDLPDGIQADLDHIRQAAQRSATVTSQLLAFGRRQLLQPAPLDLNTVVAEMAVVLRRTLGSGIRLDLALGSDAGAAMADRGQLTQALLNLALNARDAMPTGGVLRIETRNIELLAGNTVDGGAEALPGRYIALRVGDTGVGMDQITLTRIFEPFFTTKPIGQGTGLGLAMVYGMVRQSRGYIAVESEQGTGTAFTIYLPRATESPAQPTTVPEQAGGQPPLVHAGSSRLALLAEDEPLVRKLVARVLQDEGFEVLEASSGTDALELVKRRDPNGQLQLVVTDLAMPDLDGGELAQRLRGMGYGVPVPVLFISGYTDQDMERLGFLAVGHEVLRKPFSPHALAERIRSLTRGRA